MNKIPLLSDNTVEHGLMTISLSGSIMSATKEISDIFGYNNESLIGSSIDKIIPLNLNDSFAAYLKDPLNKNVANRTYGFKYLAGVRKDGSPVKVAILIGIIDNNNVSYLTLFVNEEFRVDFDEGSGQAYPSRQDPGGHGLFLDLIHDISQPLSVMCNYTQACLNLIQNENPDLTKLRDFLGKANQQALKLGRIIHGPQNDTRI